VPADVTTAAEAFAGYLTLDALIANIDRHHENWGVIGQARLAESYDHASGFGVVLLDDKRAALLGDPHRMLAWARKGKGRHFEGKPRLGRLAADALSRLASGARDAWLDRVDALDESARRPVIDAVPDDIMTDIQREFADRVMEVNRGRLLDEFRSQP
jgi:hypothetical protein